MTSPPICRWLKVAKALEVAFGARICNPQLQPESAGRGLQLFRLNLGDRVVRVEEQPDSGRRRQQLVYQFQPLLSGSMFSVTTPVTLPPGRFRLATSPASTGSTLP